jgi:hypothetical protein
VTRARWAAVLAVTLPLLAPAVAQGQRLASRELQAEAAQLVQELARLRGLPTVGLTPRVVVRSREERRRFILGELKRKYPESRLAAERRAMVAWGLVPPGFDLGGFLTDLVLEQAAAYYDPVAKVMVLANWLGAEEQREALTHELVHFLQDRQIELDRFLTAAPGHGDEALARQALIEGEAVALTLDRALQRGGQDFARLPDVAAIQRAIMGSGTGPVLGRAPRFLRALLTFPYARGLGFAHAFRQRAPWSEFARLYADPPRSTTHILHPERFLERREDPVGIGLPDLAALLGPGARRVFEDDAGEFGFTSILREFVGDAAEAAGWRGDRYEIWDNGRGGTVLCSLSVWESDEAAAGFADAYARLLPTKHGLGAPETTATEPRTWQRGDETFLVERRGREVLLLERLPATAREAVRRALWQSRPAGRAPAALSGRRPG